MTDSKFQGGHATSISNGILSHKAEGPQCANGLQKTTHNGSTLQVAGYSGYPSSSSNVQEWTPPDGGYGWVIVGLSAASFFLFVSYTQLGIFLIPLQDEFNVSKTSITWLNSAHTVVGRVLGILTGQILSHSGGRVMLTFATLLYAGSYLITSFVESFPVLFLTFGIMPSIASGCIAGVALTSVQQYFDKKRSMASGLAALGVSVGTFSWSPLGAKLLQIYGWRITFRIESAMYLALGLAITIFLQPAGNQKVWLDCRKVCHKTNNFASRSSPGQSQIKGSILNKLKNLCDFSLLRNVPLCVFWIGLIIAGIGYLVNSIYQPVRAEMLGIDKSTAAFTTSVFGIGAGIGVPCFAFVGNSPCVRRDVMMAVGMIVTGLATLFSTLFESSILLLISAGVLGFCGGSFMGVSFVVTVDMIEPRMIAAASGFQTATLGISHLVTHPIAGFLWDETDNPQAPFYMAGISLILGGIILSSVPIIRHWQDGHAYGMNGSSDIVATVDQNIAETCRIQYKHGQEEEKDDFHVIHL